MVKYTRPGYTPIGLAEFTGGFIGYWEYDPDWVVENCFWDTQTSGTTTSMGGTGKTTVQMKDATTFMDTGWNFVNIWHREDIKNDGYPYLIQGTSDCSCTGGGVGDVLRRGCPNCPPVSGGVPKQPSNWFGGGSGEGLPLHNSFQAAAVSLDWSLGTTYMVVFLLVAIGMGVGLLIATGSILAGILGFSGVAAIFSGTGVVPLWIAVVVGLVGVMSVIISRSI